MCPRGARAIVYFFVSLSGLGIVPQSMDNPCRRVYACSPHPCVHMQTLRTFVIIAYICAQCPHCVQCGQVSALCAIVNMWAQCSQCVRVLCSGMGLAGVVWSGLSRVNSAPIVPVCLPCAQLLTVWACVCDAGVGEHMRVHGFAFCQWCGILVLVLSCESGYS